MIGAIYNSFNGKIEVREIDKPSLHPKGAIIQVKATGLCRSDWHGWKGHDKDIKLPHVPGHEFAGVIVELGKQVKNWKIGDRVTVPFVCACGSCPQCHHGNQQICDNQSQPGFTHWGSFAEYTRIENADLNLVALPDDISFETAASLGCRFATSFRAVVDLARVQSEQWVAVHGCGGVGLSAIMIAKSFNASVIAIDIQEKSLQYAIKCGAEYTINPNKTQDVPTEIIKLSQGGVHASFDALGNPDIIFNSLSSLRKRGKHVQIGLLKPELVNAAIPTDLIIAKELEIVGSHGLQAHRYDELLHMIKIGKLDPSLLISSHISLTDAVKMLPKMDAFKHAGIHIINQFM